MLTVCVLFLSQYGITIPSPFYRQGPDTHMCHSPKIPQLAGVRDRICAQDRVGWVWLCPTARPWPPAPCHPPLPFMHHLSFLAQLEPGSSCASPNRDPLGAMPTAEVLNLEATGFLRNVMGLGESVNSRGRRQGCTWPIWGEVLELTSSPKESVPPNQSGTIVFF